MKFLRYVLIGIFLGLTVFGFFIFKNNNKNKIPTYVDITATDLKQYIDEGKDIYLLDVHTPEQEHIKGTDAFIPFSEIEENKKALPKDKDTEIIVYCRSGNMSRAASQDLSDLGYTNVKNVVGGINAWKEKGFDKVDYNKPFAETHNSTYEFGKIRKEDGIVNTTFEIENHGKETLVLSNISTSCGCTSAKIDKTELGFDEETELTVYFDPNFHEEPEGKFTRSVFVQTNDPDLPEMQFDIHVEILD